MRPFLLTRLLCFALTACGPVTSTSPPLSDPPVTTRSDDKTEQAKISSDGVMSLPDSTLQSFQLTRETVKTVPFQSQQHFTIQVFRESDEEPLPGRPYRSGYAYASAVMIDHIPEQNQAGKVTFSKEWRARIIAVNPLRNFGGESKQVEVLVEIQDAKHELVLGDSCTITLAAGTETPVLAVPSAAILNTTEGTFVYLQRSNGIQRVEVKLGDTQGGMVAVNSGLKAEDQVVTHPVQTLWLTEIQLKQGGTGD